MNEIRAHRVYILPENGGTPFQREVVFLEELKRACQLDPNNQLILSTRRQNMTAPVTIAFIQGKAGVDFNTAYWFFNQQNHKRVNK